MFKGLKTAVAIALSIGGLGTAVTLSAVAASPKEIQQAQADTETVKIYINTANWGDTTTGVKFYSWVWETDKSGAWFDFTKSEDHLYYISVGSNITNFIFFRAGENMSHGWDKGTNYWNKTGDLASGGKNKFTFSGYSTGSWGFEKDEYIYYVSDSNQTTENKIYSWGYGNQFGGWSGAKIKDLGDKEEVQGTLHFDGNDVKIYKIPYASSDYGGFLFNYNGSSQSDNKVFVSGDAYTWAENDSGACGDALELLLDIEAARNAATWKGHSWSVCGISSSDATSFCNRYNALDATGKSYINNSTTYTYTDETATDQDDISYELIMDRLSIISGVPVSGANRMIRLAANSNAAIIIGVITAVLAGTGVAFFLLRKKRKEQ